jgi:hypothetical protein
MPRRDVWGRYRTIRSANTAFSTGGGSNGSAAPGTYQNILYSQGSYTNDLGEYTTLGNWEDRVSCSNGVRTATSGKTFWQWASSGTNVNTNGNLLPYTLIMYQR